MTTHKIMMRNMRTILLAALLLAGVTAGAVKMKPGLTAVVQSDGTTLLVEAFGDEDFSYFVSEDGVLLCQEGTDFFIAETMPDGTLNPTALLAHSPKMRTEKELAAIAKQDREAFRKAMSHTANTNRMRREPLPYNASLLPHTGSPAVPVLLVEFSDTTFKVDSPAETFNKYLNAEELFDRNADPSTGRNYGSVARYFRDMSGGKFTPKFDVYGPVRLNQPLKYYGAGASSQEKMDELFADACAALGRDSVFAQYDSNDDGYVDLIYIIYAGYAQSIVGNSTDCIHPKSGTLATQPAVGGKKLLRYGVNNELNGTPADQKNGLLINGIGLFCHEFSHCMGLPDLYPQAGSVAERCINQNLDYWDLMDAGEYTYNGYRPTEYSAWERERFGWIEIDTLDAPTDVTLAPLSAGGKAYRILNDNDPTGHEYYIVENVQQTGWNKSILGHGMLVSHVDYSDEMFTVGGCKVNSTPGHPRMTLIAADGLFVPEYFRGKTISESSNETERLANASLIAKYGGQLLDVAMYKAEAAGDPYPGTMEITSLTDDSSPASAWTYTGGSMGQPLTEISEDTETGIVTFKFKGGTPSGITSIRSNHTTNASFYTLEGVDKGREWSTLPKGIYVRDGKKVVKQ